MALTDIITLLTDFGIEDPYVGIMKGVILSINKNIRIVDISHSIPPQDIISAGFTLNNSFSYFPEKTIHLAVVDPGVGSKRSPILIETEKYFFIGPDNGIFSSILSGDKVQKTVELTNSSYFLSDISSTFHGRDIFAPAAAHLSLGENPGAFGPLTKDPVILQFPEPIIINTIEAEGKIIHIDRFGNLITNVSRSFLEQSGFINNLNLEINNIPLSKIVTHYAAAEKDELFCIFGSSNLLEISIKNSSAQKNTGIKKGDKVIISKKSG